jgi:hypothetical protein
MEWVVLQPYKEKWTQQQTNMVGIDPCRAIRGRHRREVKALEQTL